MTATHVHLKKWIVLLLAVSFVNAGRISVVSESFVLRDQPMAAQKSALSPATAEPLSMTIVPGRSDRTVTLHLRGVSSYDGLTLRIYGINGSQVEDLSGLVRRGSPSVIWRAPSLSSGLFFATLRSGRNVKTIGFVVIR